MLPIACCFDCLFKILESVVFHNWTSSIALVYGSLLRRKRIDVSANDIPLVMIASIPFTSVMFAIVRVSGPIFLEFY